jgi:hypothetical protein
MASYDSVKSFSNGFLYNLSRLDALLANTAISTTEFACVEGLKQTLTANVVSTSCWRGFACQRWSGRWRGMGS